MKEKLIIRNFGPIKSVELELGRFNVLIGEQATGKSTVAKVLAVCRYFSYIVENNTYYQPFKEGLNSWGLNEFIQEDMYIFYECEHYLFTAKRDESITYELGPDELKGPVKKSFFDFETRLEPKSAEFKRLKHEFDIVSISYLDEGLGKGSVPTSFYKNDVAKVMDNPFYLHTERGLQSVFSLGRNSIQNISDSLFNQFAQMDGIARQFGSDTDIEPLDIVYKNEQGRGFVKKKTDDSFYSLYNAASGYQSTIPVVLLIKYYNEIRRKRKTFIVEEPELNLFPSAQQRLMQYMVGNSIVHNFSFLLTTHSPYTLAALNNMIYAYTVGQDKMEAVNSIIPQKYWLNPKDVSAYRLLSDGTVKNVIDVDLGEIIIEELDYAGKEINSIYDEILAVKFRGDEESE